MIPYRRKGLVKGVAHDESSDEGLDPNMSKTILVIEDNVGIQQLLIFSLDLAQYSYSIVDIEKNSPFTWIEEKVRLLPGGIIFDVENSPHQNPLEFFRSFCTHWAAFSKSMPPLVLLTTNEDRADVLRGEGYSVVVKPFRTHVLLDVLKKVLRAKQEEDPLVELEG